MEVWSVNQQSYPSILQVLKALNPESQGMKIKEYDTVINPSDVCNFFGPSYIKELRKLDSNVYISSPLDLTISERYLINPFLSDLEHYLAKCDIVRNDGKETLPIFLEKGIHPYDLYLRTFNYRNKAQSWNINYASLLELVEDHCSHGLRWSFNAWNDERKVLAFGDERKFVYYPVSKINDKVDNKKDLESLLMAGNLHMDYDFTKILDIL